MIDALQSWRSVLYTPNLVWSPRLTAGLYAVSKVLDANTVIIPNICCPAVVFGIILSGAQPAFCDVDPLTGALDETACEKLLIETKAKIVLHVHPFGLYSQRDIIYKYCLRHGAFFFEDGACWFPPTPDYEVCAAGCLGLSFGWGKIFDLGGGSLLAFGDRKFGDEVDHFLRFLPSAPALDMRHDYEQQFVAMVPDDRLQRHKNDLSILAEVYRLHWIGNTHHFARAPSPEQIRRERERRIAVVDTFSDILSGHPVQLLQRSALDFPWLFCFLTKDTKFVYDMFNRNHFSLARLHPALNRLFPEFPHSDQLRSSYQFSDEIYNVNISADVTIDRIRSAAKRYLINERYRIHALRRRLGPIKQQVCSAIRRAIR
jgi:hypothetical protein